MNKTWLNDAKVCCQTLSNLVELITFEMHLENELDEFERSFEQDELKKRLILCYLI
jgi:hypothetical protein